MHTIERKIHLMEEVLKAKNDRVLDALENALLKLKDTKSNINDFVGVITEEEAEQLNKVIKETAGITAGIINEEDWK